MLSSQDLIDWVKRIECMEKHVDRRLKEWRRQGKMKIIEKYVLSLTK
jgi:hypothetical protein